MNIKRVFVVLFFILICFLPGVQADVISLNSGGSDQFAVTDKYIEGFFFCQPFNCAELGYSCGDWSDGCGREMNCGSCGAGYTCTAGSCVADAPGGGDGGGGGGVVSPYVIAVNPTEINLNMQINTNIKQGISVTNFEAYVLNIGVSQSGLTGMVLVENTSLRIPAHQTVQMDAVFVAPSEPGIYLGRIFIGNKQIPVSLNVKTELLLFDSNIVVLNENYEVRRGEQLKTLVTLIPMGDPTRLDVTLNFAIKDYTNKVYLTRTETLLVSEQIQLKRNFDTGSLPLGSYSIGLELVYPGGVAPSSAHFLVIEMPASIVVGKLILFLIILILIIAIIIIIILIRRKIKERRQASRSRAPGT